MAWPLYVFSSLTLFGVAAAGMAVLGARRWAGGTQALARTLESARVDGTAAGAAPVRYDPSELAGLPAPVQRYFRAVLSDGQPIITAATIELDGRINMSPTGQQWKHFTSRQRATTRRPGFMWDANIAMLPGLRVRVVDCYIAGEGLLRAALLGLFTVAEVRGGGEIARGEFMRYFAEAAWYPTALLPSQGVRWEAVDDTSANATIIDGALALTLLFSFDAAGLIVAARAEARGATVGKKVVMTPWECRLSDYQMRDGMMVPMTGEAAWLPREGRKVYFVGSVTALRCEFCA
jgi:hypothetical protein